MALNVLDGTGAAATLKSTMDGPDHVVHHLAQQSGSWSVSITGAIDTELPPAAALADGAANPTTPLIGACVLAFNGMTWDRWTGEVTANAGTNLNTSALALESGGKLQDAATALQIIDDWDEGDRAKVNPIAGQAGVQGGSGAVSAITQRVVLATDVALPAGANVIGGAMVEHVHGVVRIGPTQYPVKQATVRSAINNSEVTVVAGVASKKIRVLWYQISTNATFGYEWRSNSTTLIGSIGVIANNTVSPPIPPFGYFCETAIGEDLRVYTNGNTTVAVVVNYIEV